MPVIKGPLSDDNAAKVGAMLQQTLTDLYDLAIIGKHLHWNMAGPRFLSIHPHMDVVVKMCRKHYDTVAERSAGMGIAPDGRVQTIARDTPFPEMPLGFISTADAARLMADALMSASSRIAAQVEALDSIDKVTQDMLSGVSHDIDQQSWMMQAEGAKITSSTTQELSAAVRQSKTAR
jgi:starvation-inducible DNA-binding protein